jgi:hypothetical protein
VLGLEEAVASAVQGWEGTHSHREYYAFYPHIRQGAPCVVCAGWFAVGLAGDWRAYDVRAVLVALSALS